jgi:hypothetical protein
MFLAASKCDAVTIRQIVKWQLAQEPNAQACIIEQVAWNKSSLLLKAILQNTQVLQLFAKIIKTESFYKSF